MSETIVTKELAIRAAIESIASENTLLVKDSRNGRTYVILNIGNNLSIETRDDELFLDAAGSSDNGIPIYADHATAPVPAAGFVTRYFLDGDYDFMYFKWPDDSRHNRRLPLSFEEDE